MKAGVADIKLRLSAPFAVLAGLLMADCSHKDIECPFAASREVNVHFSWKNAPGASPEGMTVYFFPETEGGAIWRFDIAGAAGGPVLLPVGCYRMVTCNNDLPGVRLADTGAFGSMAAQARTDASGNALTTGMLYGAAVPHVEVTLCGVIYTSASGEHRECGKSVVQCEPDSLATDFRVLVGNVKGIDRVKSASATVRSVMTRMTLSSALPSGAEAPLLVPMDKDMNEARLEGRASGFLPVADMKYWLTLRIVRADGKVLTKDFDINGQVEDRNGRHSVIIVIDGIDVPEGGGTSDPGDVGGIAVGVDGWNVVEIDLGN